MLQIVCWSPPSDYANSTADNTYWIPWIEPTDGNDYYWYWPWIQCPACGKWIDQYDTYCRHCGADLEKPKYCSKCGQKLPK